MTAELIQLMILFFVIAVVYGSAGFGGGSSYIALLSLFPISFTSIRILALLCNITVVSGSVYVLQQHGYIQWKKIIPIILFSIPLAYIGGRFPIDERIFYTILAISLFIASLIMLAVRPSSYHNKKQLSYPLLNAVLGGGIGFLSGIVGIGGGIFLSPVLHITRWAKVKIIAGTTAVFILVNSIAGLTGQLLTNGFTVDYYKSIALMLCVFLGGQVGIRLTIEWLTSIAVRRITAILIMIVSIRLIYIHYMM